MNRRLLPNRRGQITITLNWRGSRFEVSFGTYDDRTPAEAFISATKPGSEVQLLASDAAVLLSIALQHGAPLNVIKHAMAREEKNRPQSIIGAVVDALANEVA
jgi:hypothetical protein